MHDTEIAIDILMKMLTFLPDKRSSIEEIVKHPFLEEVYR